MNVIKSPIVSDLAERCLGTEEERFFPQLKFQSLLDCIALQLGFLDPFTTLEGAPRAVQCLSVRLQTLEFFLSEAAFPA
jgi:hypothetical protein